ncbi:MAG: DUF4157 domain-containing protein [Pseudomonadota bacterium]|nr:DUF4157 domain-containing protein [Pseudomonadota bacterium]
MTVRAHAPPQAAKAVGQPASNNRAGRTQDRAEHRADALAAKALSGPPLPPGVPLGAPSTPGATLPFGPGQPLSPIDRAYFEPRLKHRLDQVRVHSDAAATESASQLHSPAYAIGKHVFIQSNHYSPRTPEGRALLAHELVHVVQQRHVSTDGPLSLGGRSDNAEREADRAADALVRGEAVDVAGDPAHVGQVIRRAPPATKPATPSPPSWLGPLGSKATHVQGDVWDVPIGGLGPTWVGPYDQLQSHLGTFNKNKGKGVEKLVAAHLVGGEHIEDLGWSMPYNKAPCVAVAESLHDKWTREISNHQSKQGSMGGRATATEGRPIVGTGDVKDVLHEVYKGFPDLQDMSTRIVDQQTAIIKMPGGSKPTGNDGGSEKPAPGPKKEGQGGAPSKPPSPAPSAAKPASETAKAEATNPSPPKPAATAEPSVKSQPPKTPSTSPENAPHPAPKVVATAQPTQPAKPPLATQPTKAAPPTVATGAAKPATPVAESAPLSKPKIKVEFSGKGKVSLGGGGWKWAGTAGKIVSFAVQVHLALETIDGAVQELEKAQKGTINPEVTKAIAALEANFPSADAMWADKFSSVFQSNKVDVRYPASLEWLKANGLSYLWLEPKQKDEFLDHLNILKWYHSGLDDLIFRFDPYIAAIVPILSAVGERKRALYDVAEQILEQTKSIPVDTVASMLFGMYQAFHDAAGDFSRLESAVSGRANGYKRRRDHAWKDRRDAAYWFNYYIPFYEHEKKMKPGTRLNLE